MKLRFDHYYIKICSYFLIITFDDIHNYFQYILVMYLIMFVLFFDPTENHATTVAIRGHSNPPPRPSCLGFGFVKPNPSRSTVVCAPQGSRAP